MKTTNSSFEETFALDSKMFENKYALHQTKDGYLNCQPRVARTGIQIYKGIEVGRPDLETVRVYRPEEEVMDHESVTSLAGKPITIEHPTEPVTASNWRDVAVGHVGREILRDGEFIRVPLHLMDARAVNEVKGGRSQLSVGYTAQLEWGDGKTPKGEPYDAKQTSIRANHVAITHTARGGPQLRMGDRRNTMATKTIMVDGLQVELEERDATMVERLIKKLEEEIATTKTQSQNDIATCRTETANAATLVQNKDAELATLRQQLTDATLTPQKIAQAARARNAVEQRAKALLDSVVITDEKSDADIRKQVVNARVGDIAKDWTDSQIEASFNTLNTAGVVNGLRHVATVIANNESTGGGDPRTAAYQQYETDLTNRWKTAGQRTPA